jgi:HEAT repeat protein/V8-like Glu-specific endopeptidase
MNNQSYSIQPIASNNPFNSNNPFKTAPVSSNPFNTTPVNTNPFNSHNPFSITQINKAIYNNIDERQNLDAFESSGLRSTFIQTVKTQAESVACLISNRSLIQGTTGHWQLAPKTPTLAQVVENQFLMTLGTYEIFGEQEAFGNEYAAGFGTAFLVNKRLAMTAAHCICKKDTDILDEKIIQSTLIVFGFQNAKKFPSDYLFADYQVYQIKKVISHQFIRIQDKNHSFTEWTDWALVELDREAPYTPLKMNMTKKVADKTNLYMLGHPYGLPLKFVDNGSVQRNHNKDFFECNLDAFGGNSGTPVCNKITHEVVGILCSGGEDYQITDNYQGRPARRIQASQITKQQSGSSGFEVCQRLDVLRFLMDEHLLGKKRLNQPQNASKLIVHSLKEYYQSRNTIPRLLHSALSIEDIYTELVLIQTNKKEEKQAFQEQRINSWEDIYAAKEPIELASLFKNKEGKEQNRLLILGRAGIGKSTLCQYIAHRWAGGKLWNDKFDALFWVPLRKLQHAHSAETASSFIFRHCCQAMSEDLYANDVAAYLKHNKERILFVLDGLDEITMEENSLQKGIIHELLKFPHWIMTSRPHAAGSIQADATIENVGFASKTIDLYIQKSFQENGQAIIQKVRQNPLIFGLCHIPINLELVCSILKKSKGDITSINSMTGLYEELTLILLKRFLEKIGRPMAWEWKPGDFEHDPHTKPLLELLESIAWTGMLERQLLFSFKTKQMENIYFKCELKKRDELFTQICMSGFLQSTGDSEDILSNEYSFLHLTFQEFFAARYLVRLLENREQRIEASNLIKRVKFDSRYKVVMWFTAGLLRMEGGDFECLNAFFQILDTPKDCVGFYSALLKARCLEECSWQARLQKLDVYEKEIQFWCGKIALEPILYSMLNHLEETFEISHQGTKRVLIPQLEACLSSGNKSDWSRSVALKVLCRVNQADPQGVLPFLEAAFKDKNECIRRDAIEALGKMDRINPQFARPLFAQALKDEEADVRKTAITALGKIGIIDPEFAFPLLAQALKDEDREIREAAIKALGKIAHSDPQGALPLLAQALKDEEADVRKTAKEALGKIAHSDPQGALPLLAQALKDEDHGVRENAIEVLGKIGIADPQLVLPLLIEALKDKGWSYVTTFARRAAAKALGKIGLSNPQLILPLLIKAFNDRADNVREAATEALGEVGYANPQLTLPLLAQIIKDGDGMARINAAWVLCKIGRTDPQDVLPLLIEALQDREEYKLRKDATRALGEIGHADPQGVLPLLAQALKDENVLVRGKATEAIGKIGHADPQGVLPLLAKSLKDKDEYVRKAAANALGKIGHADPQGALPLLAQALKDKDEAVRLNAIEAIGKIGHTQPQDALPLLAKALKDKEALVKIKAAKAIDKIGHAIPELALPLLVVALKDKGWMSGAEEAADALPKYNLASFVKPNLLHDYYVKVSYDDLFASTPISSLITCYKEKLSKPFPYFSAIALKCIEENQAIFQQDDSLCFYEQGNLCKVELPKNSPCFVQIECLADQYPKFLDPSSSSISDNCSIQ